MSDEQSQSSAEEGRSDSEALLAAANHTTEISRTDDDCELCKHIRQTGEDWERPYRCAKHGVDLHKNGLCDEFAYFDD